MDFTPSPLRLQLSSIFGSISFSCWMILMIPQLVEQWKLKSVEGISPIFLMIWAAGDLFNLIGSLWAHLLPEVILIAIWFLCTDLFTLGFYYFIKMNYNLKHYIDLEHQQQQQQQQEGIPRQGENEPLLEHGIHEEYGVSAHPHNKRRISHSSTTLENIVYEPENHSVFQTYILPISLVIFAGIFGSILSPNGSTSDSVTSSSLSTFDGPQIMGYISAFLYLTARLPQIYHNYSKKSTSGLSLLFFIFTMMGNVTYALQIITYRNDWQYIKLNLSWLLGSFGTIIEDLIIVYQFYQYRNNK